MPTVRSRSRTVLGASLSTCVIFVALFAVLWRFQGDVTAIDVGLPVLGSSLLGGAAAGHGKADTVRDGAVTGLFTGFVAGALLGSLAATVFLFGTRVHPPASMTLLEVVAFVLPVGLGCGVVFAVGGSVGGYLGFRRRRRVPS